MHARIFITIYILLGLPSSANYIHVSKTNVTDTD